MLLFLAFISSGCSGTGNNHSGTEDDNPSFTDVVDGFTSQPSQIFVDGEGRDWSEVALRHADVNDGAGSTALQRLWVAHSKQHLFLRLTLDRKINLEQNNELMLYLDTDNDPTTGDPALGLGAELIWTFGDRTGRLGSGTTVGHANVGLASLPTVRADTFEIALDRSIESSTDSLSLNDSLRIAMSSGGDRLPDDDGGLGYVLSEVETTVDAPLIDRPAASDLRLLSYNVPYNFNEDRNSLFSTDVQPHYRRLLQAIGPDVIGFQEMYEHSAEEIEQVVEGELGLSDTLHWAKTGTDLVLGSRHSIRDTQTIRGADGFPSGAFLLDTEDALGRRLVVVLMHPKCCSGNEEDRLRQETVDGVVAFLREVKRGDGPFGVAADTPVVIAGDMNFVGAPQQPRTLRTGQIVNTDEFGASVSPDWDGSPLLDTNPRQTTTALHTTTFHPSHSFPPGRLDYVYVTDSVIDVVHEFVLNTTPLSESQRTEWDLHRDDTVTASDHLPLVVDLTSR